MVHVLDAIRRNSILADVLVVPFFGQGRIYILSNVNLLDVMNVVVIIV